MIHLIDFQRKIRLPKQSYYHFLLLRLIRFRDVWQSTRTIDYFRCKFTLMSLNIIRFLDSDEQNEYINIYIYIFIRFPVISFIIQFDRFVLSLKRKLIFFLFFSIDYSLNSICLFCFFNCLFQWLKVTEGVFFLFVTNNSNLHVLLFGYLSKSIAKIFFVVPLFDKLWKTYQ